MRTPAIGRYRDADRARHELVVRETADGGWRVLDVNVEAETARLVEALTGDGDGRPQAEAVARDYLTNVVRTSRRAGPQAGEAISEAART